MTQADVPFLIDGQKTFARLYLRTVQRVQESGGGYLAAVNMLRRKQWAWWFATMLFAIDGAGDVISSFVTRDFVRSGSGAVISFAFLYALTRLRVRRYFKQIP
jgi:hypothetical protein